ncbi:MAG: hypothetical protein ACJ74Y_09430 [Bryobacteraceae bacterium]
MRIESQRRFTQGGTALLVFSELFYPGRFATVNGKETSIHCANEAFRSVLVPGGDSTVELRYRPLPLYLGAAVSMAAFLATLVSVLVARHRKNSLTYAAAN